MGLASHLVGAPGVDPEYVIQLVSDVRGFADVLLNLKEAFHRKGEFYRGWNVGESQYPCSLPCMVHYCQ